MRRPTIYEALRDKLGREPSHREQCDEVRRILREANTESLVDRATRGRLQHQTK